MDETSFFVKKTDMNDEYYISQKVLGKGANRPIYKITHNKTKVTYALKILDDTMDSVREIDLHRKAMALSEHVVKIKELFYNKVGRKKYYLMVMEYMEGGDLYENLVKRENPFTEQEIVKIMYQVFSAVNELHNMNIAHRDLKLENILLTSKDENAIVKIADFGFAKEARSGLTTPCCTEAYAAPEVLFKKKNSEYDISVDIWSLGVIMYILCFGSLPIRNPCTYPEKANSSISKEAIVLISSMLRESPEDRINIGDIMRSEWIRNYKNSNKITTTTSRPGKNRDNLYKIKQVFENFQSKEARNNKLMTRQNIQSLKEIA